MKKICFALTLLLCCGSAFAFGSVAGEKGSGITDGFSRDDRLEVVKDDIYRLMWQDQQFMGSSATLSPLSAMGDKYNNKMTYAEAVKYCDDLNFAGFDDWRLPTANELFSITDDTRFNPAINKAFKKSHTRRTTKARKDMAGAGALLSIPTSRLTRGSCVSGMAAISGAAILIATSCGASEIIDFKI